MKIHEYQGKQLLRAAGVAVPRGVMVQSGDAAVAAYEELGGELAVLKSQIHAGGRGKGRFLEEPDQPGVVLVRSAEEIRANANVELCFVDAEHWQVRVAGKAEEVEDTSVKKKLMETTLSPQLWGGFFPDGETDKHFVLYRIRPRSFEWMKEWELSYRRVEL